MTGFVSDDPAYASGGSADLPGAPDQGDRGAASAQSGDGVRVAVTSRVPASGYLAGRVPVTLRSSGRTFSTTTAWTARPGHAVAGRGAGHLPVDAATGPAANGEQRTPQRRRRRPASIAVRPEDAQASAADGCCAAGTPSTSARPCRLGLLALYRSRQGGTRHGARSAPCPAPHRGARRDVGPGRLVLSRVVSGVDDGLPGNGIGSALTSWRVPTSLARGRYTLRVTDAGGWYSTAASTGRSPSAEEQL